MASSNKSAISVLFLAISLVFFAGASTTTETCPFTSLGPLASCGLPLIPFGLPGCNCFNGLTDLQAAVCLCAAIKANVFNLVAAIDVFNLVTADVHAIIADTLGNCNRLVPSGFTCA